MTTEPPLQDTLWWLIPGQLAGMRKPRLAELPDLATLGIGAIVSVMDDPSNLEAYAEAEIPYRWLPTQGGTPPTRQQVTEFQAFVAAQQAQGRAVAVHCSSGRRRTGTLLAAYLVRTGLPAEAAEQAILTANPQIELRAAQRAFLQDLAKA